MMFTNVVVNLEMPGVHCWPGCPFHEVDFLKNPHRHQFVMTCKKRVSSDDREIEIIKLKRDIANYLQTKYASVKFQGDLDFDTMSCEMIARELVEAFGLNYCKVLEDGENGAEVCL